MPHDVIGLKQGQSPGHSDMYLNSTPAHAGAGVINGGEGPVHACRKTIIDTHKRALRAVRPDRELNRTRSKLLKWGTP
jgi:hypothetical protein